uniref:Uncharacterized protein n=1 Tax=Panagrolaimus davidi TaxID=227884 RepID=A0A914P5S2_9BILA
MNNKNALEFGEGIQKYQKQISIVMTVEALIPFVTVALPVLLDITTIVLGINLAWAGKIAFFLGALATFVNPIVKLSVISCYRKRLIDLILCRRIQVQQITPQSVSNFPLKIV